MKKLLALLTLLSSHTVYAEPLTIDECQSKYYAKSISPNETIAVRYSAAKAYKTCLINAKASAGAGFLSSDLDPQIKAADDVEQSLKGKNQFMGQNFGIGFAVSFTDTTIVNDASVVNGKVVANSTIDKEARVLLEFHTHIACNDSGKNGDFGCGPFAAIATTQQDVIGGVGLGWLWSWRNKSSNDGSGFSLGIGAILDNDVKDLATGFSVGNNLPTGETEIRYSSESRVSYLLFITNTF